MTSYRESSFNGERAANAAIKTVVLMLKKNPGFNPSFRIAPNIGHVFPENYYGEMVTKVFCEEGLNTGAYLSSGLYALFQHVQKNVQGCSVETVDKRYRRNSLLVGRKPFDFDGLFLGLRQGRDVCVQISNDLANRPPQGIFRARYPRRQPR